MPMREYKKTQTKYTDFEFKEIQRAMKILGVDTFKKFTIKSASLILKAQSDFFEIESVSETKKAEALRKYIYQGENYND